MKRKAAAAAERYKLDTDILVAHLLEQLMKEQIINQATYMKAKKEVSRNERK